VIIVSLKLSKPFTKTGEFFIPEQDVGWRGSFSYDPTKGLFLHLKNLPLSYKNDSGFKVMTGIIDGHPYSCTLVNIIPQESMFSGNQDGLTRTNTFAVEAILLGKRISDERELVFDQVHFSYSNFREWLNKPTIFLPYTEGDKIATIKKLPKIKGALDDSFNFQIEIGNEGEYPKESFDISLRQYVTFGIVSKNGKLFPLKYFLHMNKIIKYFFMFLQGRYVTEESIFCGDKAKAGEPLELVQFYRRFKKAKKLKDQEHFTHDYNPLIFERILQNWIKKYNNMPDFFDRFFENVIKDDLSPIDKFENLCQSLLSYYNYKFEERRQSEEEYTSFFNTLISKLENDEKQFVERFRLLGNRFSLRQQLDKIFEQLDYLKDKDSRDRYVNAVVDLRNRIEHATENISHSLIRDAFGMAHNLTSFTSNLILHEIEYDEK